MPSKAFKCLEVGYFVDEGDQKSVRVAHGIHRDQVASVRKGPVIPMPADPLVDNLQMYPAGLDQFHTWGYGSFGQVAFKDCAHITKLGKYGAVIQYLIPSYKQPSAEFCVLLLKVMRRPVIIGILLLILGGCDTSSNDPLDPESLYGSWELIEVLIDPGDGSGEYNPVDTGETITLKRDGTYESNWDPCASGEVPGNSFEGTFTATSQTRFELDCDGALQPVLGTLEDGLLAISYGCIEPCLYRFLKTSDL